MIAAATEPTRRSDLDDFAVDQAQDVARLAPTGHGERLALRNGHLGPSGCRSGLGHRDHVVAEMSARIVHGHRG